MKKTTDHAFGKEVYLLGIDENGTKYWLKEPKWDCGWYWGMGYIETYTNKNHPHLAKDISSHQHFDSTILNKKQNGFDEFKSFFKESVLNDNELWKLIELFKTAYTLQETAAIFGEGGSHYTINPCEEILQSKEKAKNINNVLLPALFTEIKKLLTE